MKNSILIGNTYVYIFDTHTPTYAGTGAKKTIKAYLHKYTTKHTLFTNNIKRIFGIISPLSVTLVKIAYNKV